jgi:hypothetical protein
MAASEVDALKAIDDALKNLSDTAACERVLRWAWARYVPNSSAPNQPQLGAGGGAAKNVPKRVKQPSCRWFDEDERGRQLSQVSLDRDRSRSESKTKGQEELLRLCLREAAVFEFREMRSCGLLFEDRVGRQQCDAKPRLHLF